MEKGHGLGQSGSGQGLVVGSLNAVVKLRVPQYAGNFFTSSMELGSWLLSYSNIQFLFCRNCPTQARAASCSRFVNHTKLHTTFGKIPLDEGSAGRRDLYLITHNTHKRQTFMPQRDSNPQFQKASVRRDSPWTAQSLVSAVSQLFSYLFIQSQIQLVSQIDIFSHSNRQLVKQIDIQLVIYVVIQSNRYIFSQSYSQLVSKIILSSNSEIDRSLVSQIVS